ncbi:MAG: hypothetical protein WD768_19140 [Phycisphaeraceae bacterium]
MLTTTPRHLRRTRGTAMAESLLALPFLMLILLFIIYFGRNSVRVQRTHVVDRYEAWREAGHGPGPRADDVRGHPQINDAFFANKSDSIGHSGSGYFPPEAPQRWADYAGQRLPEAGELAQEMIDDLARGRTAHFSTRFDSKNKILETFNGPINATHTVQGNDWKYVNGFKHRGEAYDQTGPYSSNLPAVRDIFYEDWDQSLESMSDQSNPFAKVLRGLYLDLPGYRGPKVQ